MTETFTGIVLEGKSVHVPREPARQLSAPYILVQNFWYAGMNLVLFSTEQGFRNQLERLVDDNPKDPFKVLRWMCRDMDRGQRIDHGFCLNGIVTPVETYVNLPERNAQLFNLPESPTYVKIVPEKDCMVVLKSVDLQKYLDKRMEFYEKHNVGLVEALVNSK